MKRCINHIYTGVYISTSPNAIETGRFIESEFDMQYEVFGIGLTVPFNVDSLSPNTEYYLTAYFQDYINELYSEEIIIQTALSN